MFQFSKSLFIGVLYLAISFSYTDLHHLSAYVVIPRSNADTTDRMNAGGDPADRPGLRDFQRSPEYLDDWWGVNDYYYSRHGIRNTQSVRHPEYTTWYPLPNTYYQDSSNYYNANRYYRPGYPRGP